jgi:hypothetical protein
MLVIVLVIDLNPCTITITKMHEQELERMGDRAVYCARLESVCAERHRGFESPPIRGWSLGLASPLTR